MRSWTFAVALTLAAACGDKDTTGGDTGAVSADDTATAGVDADGDGYIAEADGGDDCDDADRFVNPGEDEECDGVDNDCDGGIDDADPEGAVDAETAWVDGDGDGYGGEAVSVCDAAGYVENDDDCDDGDAAVNPDGSESCDGIDNDCNGTVDDPYADGASTWYQDADGDGYGDPNVAGSACEQPDDFIVDDSDCDDGDAAVNPAATEVCDGVDNDCDGDADSGLTSTFYGDGDADGYGDDDDVIEACAPSPGYGPTGGDCDDDDADVNPGATEVCNDLDDDCDGLVDPASAVGSTMWFGDGDGDGYGDASDNTAACDQPTGYVDDADDCDDGDASVNPAASEVCDDIDNDCDGDVDGDATDAGTWYIDSDGDGYGDSGRTTTDCDQPTGFVDNADDCDDREAASYPGNAEVCDDIDNDCDGDVDGGATDEATYYMDLDGDGYGDADTSETTCDAPSGYVSDSADCDDADQNVYPAAEELCDGVQNDCDADFWTDESEAGLVSWFDADGLGADASADLAGGSDGSPVTWAAPSDGALNLCGGTWYANLDTHTYDVAITGIWGSASNVLDGGGGGSVIATDDGSSGGGGDLSLSGLTITGGYAENGGGIHQYIGDLDLDDVLVTGNEATNIGGGIYMPYSSGLSAFDDVEISYNVALYGAGAYIGSADLDITNSEFLGNDAASGYCCGGLSYSNGTLDLVDTDFTNNTAGYAGAMYIAGSDATMTGGAVSNNTTTSYAAAGYIWASTTFIAEGVTFSDNTSGGYSALLVDHESVHDYTDCAFTDNAGADAGVFTFYRSDNLVEFASSDFSGNTPYDAYAAGAGYDFGTEATGTCDEVSGCY